MGIGTSKGKSKVDKEQTESTPDNSEKTTELHAPSTGVDKKTELHTPRTDEDKEQVKYTADIRERRAELHAPITGDENSTEVHAPKTGEAISTKLQAHRTDVDNSTESHAHITDVDNSTGLHEPRTDVDTSRELHKARTDVDTSKELREAGPDVDNRTELHKARAILNTSKELQELGPDGDNRTELRAPTTDEEKATFTIKKQNDGSIPDAGVIIRRLVKGRTISTQTGPNHDIVEEEENNEEQMVPQILTEFCEADGQMPGADPCITNYETPRNGNRERGRERKKTETIQTQTSNNGDEIEQADDINDEDNARGKSDNPEDDTEDEIKQDGHNSELVLEQAQQTSCVNNESQTDEQSIHGDRADGLEKVGTPVEIGVQAGFSAPFKEGRSFSEMSLQRFGKYKVRLPSDTQKCIISAATFLDTGEVVVIDRANQKVKYVDSEFRYISSHELPARPWALCARGVDVYVTMGNTQIQHLFVKDMIIEPERTIKINGRCLGICVFGEFIAVGLQIGEIALLDTIGETHSAITLPKLDNGKPYNPWHLCVTKEENILVTDSDAGVVICINGDSDVIFKYTMLTSPRGTAVDLSGNIIIVGRDNLTGDVVRILQRDTELKRILHIEENVTSEWRSLMTWEQLEFVPYSVCYRRDRVTLVGGIQDTIKMMWLC